MNDNFTNYGWYIELKIQVAQTITTEKSDNILESRRKPRLVETDYKFRQRVFTDFLINDHNDQVDAQTKEVFFQKINKSKRTFLKDLLFLEEYCIML